jgi:hypothetical protein
MLSRHMLSLALSKAGRYKTNYCPTTNIRRISSSTPHQMLGVVIHHPLPHPSLLLCESEYHHQNGSQMYNS